jgi:hypothetical protein
LETIVPKTEIPAETRFYGTKDMMQGVSENKKVLDVIEGLDDFKEYYASRPTGQQESINKVLNILTPNYWIQLTICLNWFAVLKHANKHCSSESFPMSAYLPLVQAIRNELNAVIRNRGGRPFDDIFGEGSMVQLTDFIRNRFNMDGKIPTGRKVGLLDEDQIWCFITNPYHRFLEPQLAIQGGVFSGPGSIMQHVNNMVIFFAEGDEHTHTRR